MVLKWPTKTCRQGCLQKLAAHSFLQGDKGGIVPEWQGETGPGVERFWHVPADHTCQRKGRGWGKSGGAAWRCTAIERPVAEAILPAGLVN